MEDKKPLQSSSFDEMIRQHEISELGQFYSKTNTNYNDSRLDKVMLKTSQDNSVINSLHERIKYLEDEIKIILLRLKDVEEMLMCTGEK